MLLAVVHLLAIVALALSGLEPWLGAALGFAVFVSFAWALRRFGLLKDGNSVIRVVCQDDQWQVGLESGELLPVTLDSSAVVLGWLVVAHFRDASRYRYPVVVLPDSTGPDVFRHLRVLLKWRGRKDQRQL